MEVDIVKKIILKRLEDEEKGIKFVIDVSEGMKNLEEFLTLEKEAPLLIGILAVCTNDGKKEEFITHKVSVVGKNKILIPIKEKIEGEASLLICKYQGFEVDEKEVKIFSIPVNEMVGYQFKGFIRPEKDGLILEVSEVYCAISGKKLQETKERYNEKLIKGIVKFFYFVSGKVALTIANEALNKYKLSISEDLKISGAIGKIDKEEIISSLLSEYSKVFGKKLSENLPQLLGSITESLRTRPSTTWKTK